MDIIIERDTINIEALDAQLRAALGESISGISVGLGVVIAHLTDNAQAGHAGLARQIIRDHDASQLSPAQQAEHARLEKLAQARAKITEPLDTSKFDPSDLALTEIIKYVAWLEQEVRDLRGL